MAILIQTNAKNKEVNMRTLTEQELLIINGGSITSSFINAIARGIKSVYDLGRAFGSSFRRFQFNKLCPF